MDMYVNLSDDQSSFNTTHFKIILNMIKIKLMQFSVLIYPIPITS